MVSHRAGVQLQSGTYTVTPYSGDAHIYFQCITTRTAAFLVNLAGCTLNYAVSSASGSLETKLCGGDRLHGGACRPCDCRRCLLTCPELTGRRGAAATLGLT